MSDEWAEKVEGRALLVGDTHADNNFLMDALEAAQEAGCSHVVQLGDFGFIWDHLRTYEAINNAFAEADIQLIWIDGNHENFDLMLTLGIDPNATEPVRTHSHITYIPRGVVFDLGGRKCMGFGGAYSIDKYRRVPGSSWWSQETITDEQVQRVVDNPTQVDVLFTHDVPLLGPVLHSYMLQYGYKLDGDSKANRQRLERVIEAVRPLRIFHGHMHIPYGDLIETEWGDVAVRGLSCNGQRGSIRLLEPTDV